MDIGDYTGWSEKEPAVENLVQLWPILSGTVLVIALMIAWRAEITVRVKVLEEKVQALFELLNRK
jgi:RNAse (barnase) inhibitor barstar